MGTCVKRAAKRMNKDELKEHLTKRRSIGKPKTSSTNETAQIQMVKPTEVAKPLRNENKNQAVSIGGRKHSTFNF